MKVRELESRRETVTISPEETIGAALGIMEQHSIHHLIVVDHNEVVGLLSEHDILSKCLYGDPRFMNSAILIKDVMNHMSGIEADCELREALAFMRKLKVTALPLVSEGHVSIITETDFLNLLEKLLEQQSSLSLADGIKAEGANPLCQGVMKMLSDVGI